MSNNWNLIDKSYKWANMQKDYGDWISTDKDNFYVWNEDGHGSDALRTGGVLFGDADRVDPLDCSMGPVKAREMWSLYSLADWGGHVSHNTETAATTAVEHFLNDNGFTSDQSSDLWQKTNDCMQNANATSIMLNAFHNINLTKGGPEIDYLNYAVRLAALAETMDGFQAIAERLGAASDPKQVGLNRAQVDLLFKELTIFKSSENLLDQSSGDNAQLWRSLDVGTHDKNDIIKFASLAFGAIQTIYHVDQAVAENNKAGHNLEDEFTWLAHHDNDVNHITSQNLLEAIDHKNYNDNSALNSSIMGHMQTELAGFM